MFPGHYRPEAHEIANAWKAALIVPDANVLLHFYRYSPNAKAALKTVLTRLRDRLWVPFQIAEEFHRNRLGVIQKQASAYAEAAKETSKLLEVLRSPHKHPFLPDAEQIRMERMLTELNELFNIGEANVSERLTADPVLAEIEALLDGHIGSEPTPAELTQLRTEAKRRIDSDVPPGTCESKDDVRTLGDAVLWQEVLTHAASVGQDVIMVTDDAKDDWWVIARGKQLGPRPELVKEFQQRTKRRFWLYSAPRFIERASEYLGMQPDKAAIDSAKSVSMSRAARHRRSNSESAYLAELAKHANKHALQVDEFIKLLATLSPSQWSKIDHPMMLPADLVHRLVDLNRRCRCVARIASEVSNVQNPTFDAFSDEMYRLAPRRGCELVTALARADTKAIDMALAALAAEKDL
jgi:hypothetical protein